MKRFIKFVFLIPAFLIMSLFYGCDVYTYVPPTDVTTYENPSWAPPYTPGVRYYYLPDIECYYDLSTQEFVYLDDGQWTFSPNLPDIYSDFDLSNCFTVAINYNVYQPWMHQHYYVSHYPRYYYRDYYDRSNIPYVRGFNENTRSAVYWSENERNKARTWNNENQNTNHQFQYSAPDRQQQNNTSNSNPPGRQQQTFGPGSRQQPNAGNNNPAPPVRQQPSVGNNNPTPPVRQQPDVGNNNPTPDRNIKNSPVIPPRISGFESGARQQKEMTPVHPNQNTNYYGRNIGQPVRVQKQMRQPAPPAPRVNTREQNDNNRR